METFEKELMWSKLKIKWDSSISKEVEALFNYTLEFEKKYSRFIKWNFLDELNKKWNWEIDNTIKHLINLSLKVSELSEWNFDITISPILGKLGYWEDSKSKVWYKNIKIKWNKIFLNWTNIEFWSMWKWYIVDYIFNKLSKNNENLLVDFGWDIKFKWDFKIFLESPFKENESIWEYLWNNISLASSWGYKRKFKWSHHLVSPSEKKSVNTIKSIFISHESALISDIFSTAIFVSPLDIWLKILDTVKWLEWLIITENEVIKTPWYKWKLY